MVAFMKINLHEDIGKHFYYNYSCSFQNKPTVNVVTLHQPPGTLLVVTCFIDKELPFCYFMFGEKK